MILKRNIAGQKLAIYAWDGAAGAPKTGDAGNITARISKDGAAVAQTNDVNPTELDVTYARGLYIFDLTQAETNADMVVISAVSSTANIVIRPVIIYTTTLAINEVIQALWSNMEINKATGFFTVYDLTGAVFLTGVISDVEGVVSRSIT